MGIKKKGVVGVPAHLLGILRFAEGSSSGSAEGREEAFRKVLKKAEILNGNVNDPLEFIPLANAVRREIPKQAHSCSYCGLSLEDVAEQGCPYREKGRCKVF